MKKDILIGAGLIAILLLFFSFKAAQLGYSVPDEKRYIASVKEMAGGGDWVTPRYHGKKRFEKPILFYWLGAFSNKAMGQSLYASRFPSILFAALTVFIVYLLGTELFGRGPGLMSAFFLAGSGMFYAYSRFATPDMTLLFFTVLSIYFFIRGWRAGDKPGIFFKLLFVSMSLAVLTKGPVGAIIIIIMAAVISHPDFTRVIKKMGIGTGVLIFLAVALPWFLIMAKLHGAEYLNHIWGVEIMGRVSDGVKISNLLKAPFRYIMVILFAFLPASILLPSSIIADLRDARKGNKTKENIILLGWLISVYVFFSFIGTKKGHYMLLASPATALLVGEAVFKRRDSIYKEGLFMTPIIFIILAYTLGLAVLLTLMGYMDALSSFSYFVIAAPAILIYSWIKKKSFPEAFIASSVVVTLFLVGVAIPALDNQPLLKFAGAIEPKIGEGDLVGVGSHVISHNRLSRYLDRKVEKVNVDLADPAEHARRNKDLLVEFLERKERVFCVVTEEDYLKYVSRPLRQSLRVLDEERKWKKTNKIKFNLDLARYFLSGRKELFIDSVREKILLVSNK